MPDPVLRIATELDLTGYLTGLATAQAAQTQWAGQMAGLQTGLVDVEAAARAAGAAAALLGQATATGAAQATAALDPVKALEAQVAEDARQIALQADAAWRAVAQNENAQTALQNLSNRAAALQAQLKQLADNNPRITLNDNFADATARLTGLRTQLAALADQPYTAELGAQMATLRGQIALVSGEVQGLNAEAATTRGVFADLNGMMAGFGAMALVVGVLAVVGALKEAVSGSIEWNTTLNQVESNTTLTDAAIAQMDSTIRGMVGSSAADMDQLATGFEHATNLGYSMADATKIADASMQSALSTGANLGQVMNADASIMKEYGDSGAKAALDLNLLHNAAAQGNMELQAFVDAGGKTIATAANLGDSLDDVTAAYAALTRHGMDAAMAGTQLTGILTHIVNPTSAARTEIEHLSQVTGIDLVGDFSQAGLQAKGLHGIMEDVQVATAGDSAEILKLIPALRGGQGALALAGTGAQDFTTILNSQADVMSGRYDPTAIAFQRTIHTTGYEMGEAANQAKLLGLSVGDQLVGGLQAGIDRLGTLVTTMDVMAANSAYTADLIGVQATATASAGQVLSDYETAVRKYNETAQQQIDLTNLDAAAINAWAAAGRPAIESAQDQATAMREQAAEADDLRRATEANAAAMQTDAQTTGRALLGLDDETAKATHSMGEALLQMAKDTQAGTKDASAGVYDLITLFHNLPDQLSPEMDRIRQALAGKLAEVTAGGKVSAADLNTFYVSQIHQMALSTDAETRYLGQMLEANLADAATKAATQGYNSGIGWIDGILQGSQAAQPNIDQYVADLLKEFDLHDAFAILGKNSAQAYGNALVFGVADWLNKIADAMPPILHMISDPIKTEAKNLIDLWGQASHQFAGFDKIPAPPPFPEGPKPKKEPKPPKGPADPGKTMEQTLESIVKALQQADQDSQGPSASLAKAIEDILVVAREKVPKDAQWIKDSLDGLIAKYQAHQLTTAQYNTAVNGILQTLAKGHGDIAIAAQAALDSVTATDTTLTAKAQETAEKQVQSLTQAAGKMVDLTQQSTTTIGDSHVAMLDFIASAQDSKLPAFVNFANSEWTRMQQGTGLSTQQIHDDTLKFLTDLSQHGDALTKAWAQTEIANMQAASDAAAAHQHELQNTLAGGFDGVFADLNAAKVDVPKTITDVLALAKQAQDAGMGAQADSLRIAAKELWSGNEDEYRDGAKRIGQVFADLGTKADLQTQATMAKVNADTKAGLDAQVAAFQKAQLDIAGALGSLGTEIAGGAASQPKVLIDTYTLIDKLKANNLGDWADRLTADAQRMHDGVAGAQDQTAADVLAAEKQLRASTDPVVSAEADFQISEANRTHDGVVAAHTQTNLDIEKSVGALDMLLRGSANPSAPQALIATYDLIDKLNKAGQGDWAKRLQADADAVKAGVPGALSVMDADVMSYLLALEAGSDPIAAAWAKDLIDKATQAGQGVSTGLAQGIAQAQQTLATGLASLGKDILSGKDSPTQALIALGAIAQQVSASSDPALKALGAQMAALVANGGSLSDVLALVAQAETQLAASTDPLTRLQAQQAEAELQAAAASAQYAAQIKALQATLKSEQADLQVINDALKSQQDHLKALQDGYSKAQSALQDYASAKLAGEAANTAAGQALKGGSDLLSLAQTDLSQTGGNAAQAQALLQQQYQAILAQHQAAESALQGQIGSTSDPTQKAALQKQLEQLQAVDAQLQQSFSTALGALGSSDPTKGLQDGLKALQDRMQQLALTGTLTFDPLKAAIAGLVDPAKDAELSFGGIVSGIDKNRDAMTKLTPQIAAVQRAIADLQLQQAAEQKTIADTNTAIASEQQAMQDLASGTTTAMGQINSNVQGGLTTVASTVATQADQNAAGSIAAAWGGKQGVLTYMLGKLGGTGSLAGNAPGNAGSFVPNVYESFNDLVTNLIPDAMSGMTDVVATWGGQLNTMKDDTHNDVNAMIADFERLIAEAQKAAKYVPPSGSNPPDQTQPPSGSNPPDQGTPPPGYKGDTAFTGYATRATAATTLEVTIHHYDRHGRRTDTQTQSIELRHQNVAQGLPA